MIRPLSTACLILCAASTAQATDWSGIWRYDACGSGGDSWVIGAGGEVVINEADFYTDRIDISDAPTVGNWHSLRSTNGQQFYLAMTEAEELVFLDLTDHAIDRYGDGVDAGG